ncbi:hypothetical protein PV04_00850 [Phialophora macrospora]|uniref:Uncharacterized protein n=1 Tax=Phialophora macrospora TaxID=1851006 RepID=A0A0D2EEE1_9EURO|nr:hypothetical protein PV04_00850 [Phialophora macrospora]
MATTPAFHSQRQNLTQALAEYDDLVANQAEKPALATAEHQIYLASKALSTQLTPPGAFVLNLVFQAMIHSAAVIAGQLNIFDIVEEETTLGELAAKTGADELLLLRIMRALASAGIFTQPCRTSYTATRLSRKFRERAARSWTPASLFFMNKMSINLPEALAQDDYRNPEDPATAAMTKTFGMPIWEMLEQNDTARLMFDAAMEQQDDLPSEMLPDGEIDWVGMLGDVPAGDVAFVDVGGGSGHFILKILNATSTTTTSGTIVGRFVLQDQKRAVAAAAAGAAAQIAARNPPVECMEHDFFEEQPIRGARVYHIRSCLHDWSDSRCERILRHIRAAMAPGYSRLLIHEFVLPVVGAEQREVLFDILMMCLTGMERDETQWESLLERSGLRIVKIWRARVGHMAIIEAEAV